MLIYVQQNHYKMMCVQIHKSLYLCTYLLFIKIKNQIMNTFIILFRVISNLQIIIYIGTVFFVGTHSLVLI